MKGLKVEQLRRVCKPEEFPFQTTAELSQETTLIKQERARDAIVRALSLSGGGSNVFVVGPLGVGRETLVRQILEGIAPTRGTPEDVCYVFNFENPWKPRMIRLPQGKGKAFASEMEAFRNGVVSLIQDVIADPVTEETIEQVTRNSALPEVKNRIKEINKKLQEYGYEVISDSKGNLGLKRVAPSVLPPLSEAERSALLEQIVSTNMDLMRAEFHLEREARETVVNLISRAGKLRLEALKDYGVAVEAFINEVAEHTGANHQTIIELANTPMLVNFLNAYIVNILVDNGEVKGSPVVFESNPTYSNLVGVVEHIHREGAWITDHTFIRPGALHRANEGFLVLNIRDLLIKPFAWDALKRALKTSEISSEPIGREYALFPAKSISPEPVPLRNVKVILLGESWIFGRLNEVDPEFHDLFRIRAEFEVDMPRTPENEANYASFIRARQGQEGIVPFDQDAVAWMVEYGSRLAGDQEKLSLRFGDLDPLLQEASLVAERAGRDYVTAKDAREAREAQIRRLSYHEEMMREGIMKGNTLIDTAGAVVGQINGLAVLAVNDEYAFGLPLRITAQTFIGEKGVVNILREVELDDPSHAKGVLTFSGYFNGKYGQKQPPAFTGTLTFEQIHRLGGPSASAAELFALISSLSGIPLKQGISVTGSMNQHGQIQPIGGVNEKIEGFFETCCDKGLTGEQGVIIPVQNVKHLMLEEEVVQAVKDGKFHVWPIATVDEGLEILTGVPAGELQEDGTYPEGTVNWAVADKLAFFYSQLKGEEKEEPRVGAWTRLWQWLSS